MSVKDIIGLLASYAYAFGLLFVVEAIGKALKWPVRFTRKIIHIGAGLWVFGILALFDHWYIGIIPFVSFIVLNYVFYQRQTFKAMDDEKATLGTVYFAISISVLFILLWRTGEEVDSSPIAVAAIMAMTIGDAMASIIGRAVGKTKYTMFGHTRSVEGSAAMLVFSLLAIFLTLVFLPASDLSPTSIPIGEGVLMICVIAGTLIATLAEAISPAGLDNLTVPLLSGLVMYLLSGTGA